MESLRKDTNTSVLCDHSNDMKQPVKKSPARGDMSCSHCWAEPPCGQRTCRCGCHPTSKEQAHVTLLGFAMGVGLGPTGVSLTMSYPRLATPLIQDKRMQSLHLSISAYHHVVSLEGGRPIPEKLEVTRPTAFQVEGCGSLALSAPSSTYPLISGRMRGHCP